MGANKVFKSNDWGNTWEVISDDLTAQIDRNTWPVMGKFWSSDAVAKDVSSSQYGTIVSLDESPVKAGLLFVGTDDGLIQLSDDDGKSWTKISSFPGVPPHTYVSDIYASRFDENVVYASFDNRKNDDFKPYILKSTDKGKSWKSVSSNLPANGTVHTIEQDFVNPGLLFVGTEFGAFFTVDDGASWVQLKAGIPTISVNDLAIQKDACDLVLATFGRGFYIIDNYEPLRHLSESMLKEPNHLFKVKDANLFVPTDKIYGQGATYFGAKNPPYGAAASYYLKEVPKTLKEKRHEAEKELFAASKPIPQVIPEIEKQEALEIPPYLLITIKDENNQVIRTFTEKPKKGISRVYWDLKYDSPDSKHRTKDFDPFAKNEGGVYAMPGTYELSMQLVHNNQATAIGTPQKFQVLTLNNLTLPAEDRAAMVAFQRKVSDYSKAVTGALALTNDLNSEVAAMKQTALTLPGAHTELMAKFTQLEWELNAIEEKLKGTPPKASWEEVPPAEMPLLRRLNSIIYAQINSSSGITRTSEMSFDILKQDFPPLLEKLSRIAETTLPELRNQLDKLGAAYTPYRIPKVE
jgi:photosystem II stability/assembly factor-like uncharacterized protein